jgi:hypothetical protein
MTIRSGTVSIAFILASLYFVLAQVASSTGQSVNQNSLIVQDFHKRLNNYAKLRKRAQAGLPNLKSETSAANVKQYQQSLAQNIRAERPAAKAGDIFTPSISQLFRELIAAPIRGDSGDKIRASLRHAEPVHELRVQINQEYPQTSAMQSTPPTLLSNLPKLPPDLEYRIVGRGLILLDTKANLIVDLLPYALPIIEGER